MHGISNTSWQIQINCSCDAGAQAVVGKRSVQLNNKSARPYVSKELLYYWVTTHNIWLEWTGTDWIYQIIHRQGIVLILTIIALTISIGRREN